jgi:RNA polymerase sigma factor (sigma-70 family)
MTGELWPELVAFAKAKALSPEEANPLWLEYVHTGTTPEKKKQIHKRLLEGNLLAIIKIVGRSFRRRTASLEIFSDVVSSAFVGAADMMKNYRPEIGVPFGLYVRRHILTKATNAMRCLRFGIRTDSYSNGSTWNAPVQVVPLDALLDKTKEQYLGTISPNAETDLVQTQNKKIIARALRSLNPKEYRTITEHFGLGEIPERSLTEIGEDLKVSRERMRQIKVRALQKVHSEELVDL